MTPMPSWLSSIIMVLAPLAFLIGLAFGIDPDATGETASLLQLAIENIWATATLIIVEVKGIIDSVKRWKEDASPLEAAKRTFLLK